MFKDSTVAGLGTGRGLGGGGGRHLTPPRN